MKLNFRIKGDVPNINGITFTQEAVDAAMTELNKLVVDKRAFGRTDYESEFVLDLSKASFQITEIVKKGNGYIGEVDILDTEEGIKLKEKINEHYEIGLAMRGEIKENNIVDSFEICYPVILEIEDESKIEE